MKYIKPYKEYENINEGFFKNMIIAGMLTLSTMQTKAIESNMKSAIHASYNRAEEVNGKDIRKDLENSGINLEFTTGSTAKGNIPVNDYIKKNKNYFMASFKGISIEEAYKQAWILMKDKEKPIKTLYSIKMSDGSVIVLSEII